MTIQLADGTVLDQEGIVAVDTKLGTLYVEHAGDPDYYPGFYITLRRPDGGEFVMLLAEVDQADPDEPPVFKAHYWSPETCMNDDPVWDVNVTAEEIDSAFVEGE